MAAPKKPRKDHKKPVQISFDPGILRQVDAAKETKQFGRSAYVMQAILSYMRLKREQEIDRQFAEAYGRPGVAEEMLNDLEPFLPHQVWTDDDLTEIIPPQAEPARRSARGGRR